MARARTLVLALLLGGLSAACGSDVSASEDRRQPAQEASAAGAGDPGERLEFPPLTRRPASTSDPRPAPAAPSGAPASEPAPAAAPPLDREVERIVANAVARARKASGGKVTGSNVQVALDCIDLRTGERVASRNPRAALAPASNMKVLTAGASLLGLGAEGAFETRFEAVGDIQGGTLQGDLVVRAGADPLHRRDGDGRLDPWLDPLVISLRRAGIEHIAGKIVLDHGPFTALGAGPEWPAQSQHWMQYCGLASGFSANGGAFRVTVTSDASQAHVVLRPRNHGLKRRRTVDVKGKRNDLRIGANSGGVTVGGSVPANFGPYVREFRHPDPDQLFASALSGALRAGGIDHGGVVMPEAGHPNRARRGAEVHVMRSPIRSVLDAVLKDSNNPLADQLYLLVGGRLGKDGTRAGCAAAIERVLREHGVDTRGLVQVDGSGLSKANRVTASTLVGVHRALCAAPGSREPFLDGLLFSGGESKLAKRMAGTPAEGLVRAKTGWVGGASSLSGLILDERGAPRLAFAVVVAYPRVSGINNAAWKPMQDELCAAFASHVLAAGRVR